MFSDYRLVTSGLQLCCTTATTSAGDRIRTSVPFNSGVEQ
jgi:hypothetical protein